MNENFLLYNSNISSKNKSKEICIIPYQKNKMKIIINNSQYFILDPIQYNISNLMMLIDLEKIYKIEKEFQNPNNTEEDGLNRIEFIKILKKEINFTDPTTEINLVYGLYKLFSEIDLSGDGVMQWSEFTQFMIDRVEGENNEDNNNEEVKKEKEMIKYKRYCISKKVIDYNIHKTEIIQAIFYSKINKLLVCDYNSKIIKFYNPRTGKCECNFCLEKFFKDIQNEEEKNKKQKDKIYNNNNNNKNIIKEDKYKNLTFCILHMAINNKNILGVCLSNFKIIFLNFNTDFKCDLLYQFHTNILQKKIWFLKNHDIWLTSGRKSEKNFYYVYELDIDFIKDISNKYICQYNEGHWYRNYFFNNPQDIKHPDYNKGHTNEVLDVIEINKPQLILTACMDGKIRLFNLYDKEFIKIWNTNNYGIRNLNYAVNVEVNGLILSIGFEYYINIYSTDLSLDDAFKGKLEGHTAPVVALKVLADSYMCVSVDEEANVKIWDLKNRLCLQTILYEKKNIKIQGLCYIKKYNRFCIYGNKMIFYDQKYNEIINNNNNKNNNDEENTNYPIQCEFNKYHMNFYISTLKEIRVYSTMNGTLIHIFRKFMDQNRFNNLNTKIKCFCFDYQHRLIYIGFNNGTVQQFNAGNGSLIKSINEYEVEKNGLTFIKTHHTNEVTDMFLFWKKDIKNYDFILTTCGLDGKIFMYNENNPEESIKLRGIYNSHKIKEKNCEILCMDFSRRYNNFATGSTNGIINIWDFEMCKMNETNIIKNYKPINYNVICIKFCDPFPVLSAAYSNGEIFLWGTLPNRQLSGQCFFKTMNFFFKENVCNMLKINCLKYIYSDKFIINKDDIIDNDVENNKKIFNENFPNEIFEIDDKFYNNNDSNEKGNYLLLGDIKGNLKILNLSNIFSYFNITILNESNILSNFNLLKTEEIKAESSLIHNLLKNKTFLNNNNKFTSPYPNLLLFEKKIHSNEILHINIATENPFTFTTVSKDNTILIFNDKLNIIGEIYTGSNNKYVTKPWNFKLDWDFLKREEMEEFLEICDDINLDLNLILKPYFKNKNIDNENHKIDNNNIDNNIDDNINNDNNMNNDNIFKTGIPNIKKKRFVKIQKKNEKKETDNSNDENNNLNLSMEGKYIQEIKKNLDEEFYNPQSEKIGMNEICKNVIDNMIEGKDITDLFQLPTLIMKKNNTINKSSSTKEIFNKNLNKRKNELFSIKFIKNKNNNLDNNNNIKNKLFLPLIKHEYKTKVGMKFKHGETEKILNYEYYQNSYKESLRLKKNESVAALRANYKNMWNYVKKYQNENVKK